MLSLKNIEIGQIATIKNKRSISCGNNFRTHGMSRTKEYKTWTSIKYRCYDKNCKKYNRYGGRGIKVCDSWVNSFENFYKDMGPRPEGTSIDRIDNNGNYEPGNCRWATTKGQARNRSTNRLFDYQGRKISLAELSEITGIKTTTILMRIDRYKWSFEDAIKIKPLFSNNRLCLR